MGDPRYYLKEPPLNVPTFEGNTAKLLGIQGKEITPETFLSLFDGYLLRDGESIRLPKYMHPDRRGAFEMTANLPKCATLLNLVGKDARIDEIIFRAEKKLTKEIEKQARVVVRKQSEIEKSKATMPKGWKYPERRPDNILWTSFHHYSNRMGEPHRHFHLIVFNLSYDKQEKIWKAVELGHVDQPALGELFRKEMMTGLRQLGYKVKAKGKEYEITGFPAEIKGKFSSRNAQIKEIEASYDDKARKAGNKLMSTKARGKLSLYQRPEKEVMPIEDRFVQWVSELTKEQFGAIKSFVSKAKSAVVDLWKSRLSRHAEVTRNIERENDYERVF